MQLAVQSSFASQFVEMTKILLYDEIFRLMQSCDLPPNCFQNYPNIYYSPYYGGKDMWDLNI